ncbi:MAG TPA: hypothetical protein ENN69_07195, partial [Spirochaetia bacterium]|nr:hypothetical protein [Spirochaetia bacterium]
EPAVRDLGFEISGNRLYLRFSTDRESPYRLTVVPQRIASNSGRPLSSFGDTSFYFYYQQKSAYLRWRNGQAMVERYGPKLFPMQGRALSQVDLRIYKIAPDNRNFWPFPPEPLAVNEEARPPMPGEEPDYATNISDQIRLLGTPHISQIVSLPINENSSESAFGLDLEPFLSRVSGQNAAGTYLIGYRILGSSVNRIYVRLTVTDLALSTVEEEHAVTFVVTSLSTGRPVPGAVVTVEGETRTGTWIPVIQGTSDGAGMFRYEHRVKIDEPVRRITVSKGDDILVFDPYRPPPVFSNNHWYGSQSRWLSWINTEPRHEREKARRRGYIFTERPVYRPEEPVYIMGYVRLRQQGLIMADQAGRKRQVVVTGPGYKQWTYPVTLNGNGGFQVKFDEKDLPTGNYRAVIRDVADGDNLALVEFKKEAYRVPRFEVTISGPDRVPLDREFELILTADYYAGGRVVGQEVSWEITKYPYTLRPPGFPGFVFSTDESVSGVRYNDYDGASFTRAVTDQNGSAKLTINPALENESSPRIYVVEGTVRGADTQTVTAVKQVIAVPPFAIGLKLDRFLKDSTVIKPEIIIIDHNEKPLAGKTLTVRLHRREWHSYLSETDFTTGEVNYHTDVVDKKIFEKNYVSGDTALSLSLPVDAAGVYVVEVLAKDNLGRLQTIQSDLYVAGDTPVSWQKAYANVFETSLDKKSYAPGETATLLLKSPFQDALALIVIEGPEKNEYRWVEVKNGQGLVSIPIALNMVPRLPVHALLLRGRLPGTGGRFTGRIDRGKPIAMAATTWLTIDSVRNELSVNLEHPKVNLPGKKLNMTILVKDSLDRPVDGTASLWLVDRAVLALGEEKALRPLSAFIDQVQSALRISETRNEVVGNLPVEEIEGGDGRLEEAEGMRSSKADELFKKTTVRKNFQTVPY